MAQRNVRYDWLASISFAGQRGGQRGGHQCGRCHRLILSFFFKQTVSFPARLICCIIIVVGVLFLQYC